MMKAPSLLICNVPVILPFGVNGQTRRQLEARRGRIKFAKHH